MMKKNQIIIIHQNINVLSFHLLVEIKIKMNFRAF